MIETQQELPSLESDYPLTTEQVAGFDRDGFILLRQLCTRPEAAAYRRAIIDAVAPHVDQVSATPLEKRDLYGKAFIQTQHVWDQHPSVRGFSLCRRFAKVAAELMQADCVRMYHDQTLLKEPGGGPTPWHQDQYYIPLDTDRALTMWMPLVDVSAQMGTMDFAAGSYKHGALADVGISSQSADVYDKLIAERRWPIRQCGDMAAGDATFHLGWTVHRAGGNSSNRMREVITVLYFADGARLIESSMSAGASRLHLKGRKRGELVDSEINPVVYRK